MPSQTNQSNTMPELLRKILGQIPDLKLSDDVDLAFVTDLESTILAKLKAPLDAMAQQGLTSVPPGPGGGPMGPPMGPPPQQMPPGAPGGLMSGGLSVQPSMPSPDELRRILGR